MDKCQRDCWETFRGRALAAVGAAGRPHHVEAIRQVLDDARIHITIDGLIGDGVLFNMQESVGESAGPVTTIMSNATLEMLPGYSLPELWAVLSVLTRAQGFHV